MNEHFLDVRDDIIAWESTHELNKAPLNLTILRIRDLKHVINPMVNHANATLVLVGLDECTNPLVIWFCTWQRQYRCCMTTWY